MQKTILKEKYRKVIESDPELQGKIAKATGKSTDSVKRWARLNLDMLLLSPVLESVSSYLNLSDKEDLTEKVESAGKVETLS